MKMGKCIWCGYTKEMTLEHIIPQSCGGGEEDENKTHACIECNQERGQVSGLYCSINDFKKYLENWDHANINRVERARKMRRKLIKVSKRVTELQEKWRKIEMFRIGRSPTADIVLEIPEIPEEVIVEEADNDFDVTKNYFELSGCDGGLSLD